MQRAALFMAFVLSTFVAGSFAAPALHAKPAASWDGLVQVKSRELDLVYLQPGADFRSYTKVMIEPTEVAFAKDWQRDHNRSSVMGSARVSDRDVQEAINEGITAATDIFSKAWVKGGYAIVAEPGPDVLRVKTGVINITVRAPDRMSASRTRTIARDAGSATLFVEARDSLTGALIGRAVDQRLAGDGLAAWRNASGNRADFRTLVEDWARISVRGLNALRSNARVSP